MLPFGLFSILEKVLDLIAPDLLARLRRMVRGAEQPRLMREAFRQATSRAVSAIHPGPGRGELVRAFSRPSIEEKVLRWVEKGAPDVDLEHIKDELRTARVGVVAPNLEVSRVIHRVQSELISILNETPAGQTSLLAVNSQRGLDLLLELKADFSNRASHAHSIDARESPTGDSGHDHPEFTPRIDEAKRHLLRGSPRTAFRILDEVEKDLVNAEVAPQIRYRLHTNKGVAYLEMELLDEAAKQFYRAGEYAEEGETLPTAHLAQVEMMRGDYARAIGFAQRVLQTDSTSTLAWGVLVQCEVPTPEVASIPENVRTDIHLTNARAARALRDGDLITAETLLREALRRGTGDPIVRIWLGDTIYERANASECNSSEREHAFEEADRHATDAAAELRGGERSSAYARANNLRAVIAITRGLATKALEYLSLSLKAEEGNAKALILAARAQLRLDQPEEALALLDRLRDQEDLGVVLEHRVDALIALGRTSEVEPLIRRALCAPAGVRDRDEVVVALSLHAANAELPQLAEEVLTHLSPGRGEDWAWIVRARNAEHKGNMSLAREAFRKARLTAAPQRRRDITGEYASFLMRNDAPSEAARVLELESESKASPPLRGLYINALLSAGEFEDATKYLEEEIENPVPDLRILRMGAKLEAMRESAAGVRRFLEPVYLGDPDDIQVGLDLARARLRTRDQAGAAAIVDRLQEHLDFSVAEQMQLAKLLGEVGSPQRALEFAYRALQRAPAEAGIQLSFVALMKRRWNATGLQVSEAQADTVVKLRDVVAGKEAEYFLLNSLSSPPRPAEFLFSDPRVANLLGKCVGDEVVFRAGAPDEATLKIVSIVHIYQYAVQQVLSTFRIQHPDRNEIVSIPIRNDGGVSDLAHLIAQVARASTVGDEVREIYRETRYVPLGALRGITDGFARRAYLAAIQDPEMPVYVADGSAEAQSSTSSAVVARTIILGLSGLVTLDRLNRLDLLLELFDRIIVAESLVRDLEREMEALEEEMSADTWARAGIVDGRFVLTEVNPAESARTRCDVDRLLNWVRLRAESRPRPLAALRHQDRDMRDALGASSYDSVVLAPEADALYADDLGLRVYAQARDNAPSFPTYALLQRAGKEGLLRDGEVHSDLMTLVDWGHQFIPVDADLIATVLRIEGYQLHSRSLQMFERLGAAHADQQSASSVLVSVLKEIAITPIASAFLDSITTVMMDRFLQGRSRSQAITEVRRKVAQMFALLPVHRKVIDDRLNDLG